MTKRRLAPKQQQFVEDYITELNKLQSLPIFDKMSTAEVAKHITAVLKEQDRGQMEEKEAVADIGIVFPAHLITAHAKFLTFKWFNWSVTEGNRQLAIADLTRRYRSRRKAAS